MERATTLSFGSLGVRKPSRGLVVIDLLHGVAVALRCDGVHPGLLQLVVVGARGLSRHVTHHLVDGFARLVPDAVGVLFLEALEKLFVAGGVVYLGELAEVQVVVLCQPVV